jgi:hypothetical protein
MAESVRSEVLVQGHAGMAGRTLETCRPVAETGFRMAQGCAALLSAIKPIEGDILEIESRIAAIR